MHAVGQQSQQRERANHQSRYRVLHKLLKNFKKKRKKETSRGQPAFLGITGAGTDIDLLPRVIQDLLDIRRSSFVFSRIITTSLNGMIGDARPQTL